ncbi:MAG: hypothetical protein ACMUIG_09210 [Thermoplasmatota archaeon]
MSDHRDLTERGAGGSGLKISMKIAIAIGLIMAVSGILIGAFLPGMISDEEEYIMKEPEGELDVILEATVNELVINDTVYHDVSISTAIRLTADSFTANDTLLRDTITELVAWFFPESTGFTLTASGGGGIGTDLQITSGSRDDQVVFTDERYVISDVSEGIDEFYVASLVVRGEAGA